MNKQMEDFLAAQAHEQLETVLLYSQHRCSVSKLKSILDLSPHAIQLTDHHGNTPLHVAIRGLQHCRDDNEAVSSLRILRRLIKEYPVAMDMVNRSGHTPLDLAKFGSVPPRVLQLLADQRIARNKVQRAMSWNADVGRLLGCLAAHCHAKGAWTPSDTELVQYLVQHHPKPLRRYVDEHQNNVLHLLCRKGAPLPILQLVVHSNWKAQYRTNDRDETPLLVACQSPCAASLSTLTFLIKLCHLYPRTIVKTDRRNSSALHHLCRNTHTTVPALQLLVQTVGSKLLARRNLDRDTPLHCAVRLCHTKGGADLIRYLIAACPRALTKTNASYETPLHVLCSNSPAANLAILRDVVDAFPAACVVSYFCRDWPLNCFVRQQRGSDYDMVAFLTDATAAAATALRQAMELYGASDGSLIMRPLTDRPTKEFDDDDDDDPLEQSLLDSYNSDDDEDTSLDSALSWQSSIHCSRSLLSSTRPASPTITTAAPNQAVWFWLRRRKHSSLVSALYRMNQAGRQTNFQNGSDGTVLQGIRILAAGSDNLTCLFRFLCENPVLCDTTHAANHSSC